MQEVVDDDRTHGVELEVALAACESDGVVLADDLDADHYDRLALRWVHFAGHDRRSWFVRRENELAQTTARARSEPAHVVGYLHQRYGDPAQRRHRSHHGVE